MVSPQQTRAAEFVAQGQNACRDLDFEVAETAFNEALALVPQEVRALSGLAQVMWRRYHDAAGAQLYHDAAIAFQPANTSLWLRRAQHARYVGAKADAVADVARVLRHDPKDVRAIKLFERLDQVEIGDVHYKNLWEACHNYQTRDEYRALAHFALGNLYDKNGKYNEAFSHFVVGKELKRASVDAAARTWGQGFLERALRRALPLPKAAPVPGAPRLIFVVGMPRSGSTLLEQILTTRAGVGSVGEAPFFPKIWKEIAKECFDGTISNESDPDLMRSFLTKEMIENVRDCYLYELMQTRPAASHDVIVDKQLNSYAIYPLVHAAFPEAKIVHTKRHPLDVGCSCFMQDFEEIDWSDRLSLIGQVYRLYHATMQEYAEWGIENILDVSYERLVLEPEIELPRLLSFCELPYDDGALHPERSRNVVTTASTSQVKRPIYHSSIGRWRRYGDHLEPLAIALGGWEWIRAHAPQPPALH
jgi:tetratricopeptide (TPR) repeat protein